MLNTNSLSKQAAIAETDKVAPNLKKAINTAIKARKYPVYLRGEPGTGKTCAMAALWKQKREIAESQDMGHSVMWLDFAEFCNAIKHCRTSSSKTTDVKASTGEVFRLSESKLWDRISNAWLVCIDEIACSKTNETNTEILRMLLNARFLEPTIVTANLSVEQIGHFFDQRCADRISEGSEILVEVSGGRSLRQQQGKRMKVVV